MDSQVYIFEQYFKLIAKHVSLPVFKTCTYFYATSVKVVQDDNRRNTGNQTKVQKHIVDEFRERISSLCSTPSDLDGRVEALTSTLPDMRDIIVGTLLKFHSAMNGSSLTTNSFGEDVCRVFLSHVYRETCYQFCQNVALGVESTVDTVTSCLENVIMRMAWLEHHSNANSNEVRPSLEDRLTANIELVHEKANVRIDKLNQMVSTLERSRTSDNELTKRSTQDIVSRVERSTQDIVSRVERSTQDTVSRVEQSVSNQLSRQDKKLDNALSEFRSEIGKIDSTQKQLDATQKQLVVMNNNLEDVRKTFRDIQEDLEQQIREMGEEIRQRCDHMERDLTTENSTLSEHITRLKQMNTASFQRLANEVEKIVSRQVRACFDRLEEELADVKDTEDIGEKDIGEHDPNESVSKLIG